MFDRLREAIAILALRLAGETRNPDWSRVSQNPRTLAGVRMTPDEAVTIAAVWACLRYLSQTVAVLPWHVMRDGPKGAEIVRTHSIDKLLSMRASREWSSFQLRETLTHWALRYGNGCAEIEPDDLGRPFALWPIHPERVSYCRATDEEYSSAGDEILRGDLYYEIDNGADGKVTIAAKRMFHIRGFGEAPVGLNVIQYASQSLGWAKAAQMFGAAFFGNGATPATVIINKKPLRPEGLARQKEEFRQLYGGPRNAHKARFLDNDASIETIGSNPQETQLLELHQHLVEEICRWFGVPPHKVMDLRRATFSNIEHQAIEVVVDSIAPWVKRFEDEADFKLFGQNRQGFYSKMNMRALMRGDAAARAEFYKTMFASGAYSPNRILELEDENTVGADGNKRFVPINMTTLERAGTEPVVQPAPEPKPIDDVDLNDPVAHMRLNAIGNQLNSNWLPRAKVAMRSAKEFSGVRFKDWSTADAE